MKLNTKVRVNGRVGTICYNNLDGRGGVWGEHTFEMPASGFGNLPTPDFMLREKSVEHLIRQGEGRENIECVGEDYEVVELEEDDPIGASDAEVKALREFASAYHLYILAEIKRSDVDRAYDAWQDVRIAEAE